jgi:hypothetical protein
LEKLTGFGKAKVRMGAAEAKEEMELLLPLLVFFTVGWLVPSPFSGPPGVKL